MLSSAGGSVSGEEARGLVEATSSGALPQALSAVPAGARELTRNAAEQGFLHGLNSILLLGALLSFGGAVLALTDVGTPVWFRLTIELATHRVLVEQMTARARFVHTRFVDFGKRFEIEAPR